jgi:hypothetical protein
MRYVPPLATPHCSCIARPLAEEAPLTPTRGIIVGSTFRPQSCHERFWGFYGALALSSAIDVAMHC